jgi:hypothetical protein
MAHKRTAQARRRSNAHSGYPCRSTSAASSESVTPSAPAIERTVDHDRCGLPELDPCVGVHRDPRTLSDLFLGTLGVAGRSEWAQPALS